MTWQRIILLLGLLAVSLVWLTLQPWHSKTVPIPDVRAEVVNPYQGASLAEYGRFYRVLRQGSTADLKTLLGRNAEDFLTYRVLLALAQDTQLSAAERADYYQRAFRLQTTDPLARGELRQGQLELAQTAEQAGLVDEAIAAYAEALPLGAAFAGLERLGTPLTLATIYLQTRQYSRALASLGDREVPSIEAPAYRALGEHQQALDAFRRWLAEDPGSEEARYGEAWSLLSLGQNGAADALFAALPGADALYGRGIIARRQGDIDAAVDFFAQTNDASYMWQATDLLEAQNRADDAIPIYLDLARLGSTYADDAAFRALVLAERYSDEDAAAQARALLPAFSYFGLRTGDRLELPQTSSLPDVDPPVLALADALMGAHDPEAAVGELLFALRDAKGEAATVAIAEKLQALGEFRQSGRAAEAWVANGSRDLRTWRAAYPRAYPTLVDAEAAAEGLEPELLWAVMRTESRFYPQAVSYTGAKGLMQFVSATWDWVAELLGETPGDPFDPEDNIRYGAFYLRWLTDYFGGDLERVVPSYNGGQGYIGRLFEAAPINRDKTEFFRFIDRTEPREYLQAVLLDYEIYKGLY